MHTEKPLEDQSVTSDSYTSSFDLYRVLGFSYQATATSKSNPVGGYVMLQASNNNVNWTDIDDSKLLVSASGDEVFVLEDANVTYRYVRLKLHVNSGSFTSSAWFNAQEKYS